MYISFGAVAAIMVSSGGTLDPGLTRFLAGSVFSVGLMLVLIPGSELFTGNILMAIGLLYNKYSFFKMLRNWFAVYLGNLLGALLVAWLILKSGLFVSGGAFTPAGTTAVNIANSKMSLTVTEAIARGALCNMLVCLAVIMSIASRSVIGKIFGIFFPIMVFVASGYEHSVANMFFLPAGLMVEGRFASGFFGIFANLIPVTLGNILGGLSIVFLHPKTEEKLARILTKKKS
jgi:formate/nitrite transporter